MAAVQCSTGKLWYPLHGCSLTHETHPNIVSDSQPPHSNSTSWIRILSPLAQSDLDLELFVSPLRLVLSSFCGVKAHTVLLGAPSHEGIDHYNAWLRTPVLFKLHTHSLIQSCDVTYLCTALLQPCSLSLCRYAHAHAHCCFSHSSLFMCCIID